jgi:selenide,water dikinase
MLTNAGARPGDVLFLTKPIGTGVVATALKFERIDAALADAAIQSMRTLNRAAAEALGRLPVGAVHACTDITGFGLAGHGSEMAAASRVTLSIRAAEVPLFQGVAAIAAQNRSGGMATNQEHFGAFIQIGPSLPPNLISLMYDPQTSGGLLIAAASERADEVAAALAAAGVAAFRIGDVTPPAGDTRVRVV